IDPKRPVPSTKLNRQPIEKFLSRKVRRFTSGFGDRSTRMTNIAALTRQSARRPAAIGEVQPRLGASLIPISSAASATAPSASENTSKWRIRSKDVRSFSNDNDATEAATTPGNTLIRKSQCQE